MISLTTYKYAAFMGNIVSSRDDQNDTLAEISTFTAFIGVEEINDEYQKNYPKYIAYARILTPSKQQAEDLVQQAFSNIIQFLNKGNEIKAETVGAYIKSTIRNVSISQHRKNNIMPSLRLIVENEKSPDELHAISEQSRTIIGLISELSPSQKAILVMYYYDGMKIEEIARDLNLSSNTVSTHLRRAKKQLEKTLLCDAEFNREVS